MMAEYQYVYNQPSSNMKVDNSWERYMEPIDSRDKTPDRYAYSIFHLYGTVLDIGAGDGYGAYLMSQDSVIDHIVCVEIQDKAIERMIDNLGDLQKVTILKACAEEIPIYSKFDSVHCGHTLEHVLDLEATLRSIQRLSKDKIVISVPLNGGINRMRLREFTHEDQAIAMFRDYFKMTEYKVFPKNDRVSSIVMIGQA